MSKPARVLSSKEAKARIRATGQTITDWALSRGYTRNEVYRVLNGQSKGHYGRAHDIAVELGIKDPQVEFNSPTAARNLQKEVA